MKIFYPETLAETVRETIHEKRELCGGDGFLAK
jgi:hypothetical protein